MMEAVTTATTMTGAPIMTIEPVKAVSLRHERTPQINLREGLVLSQRLRKLFAHDKHAGPDGFYRVTSLYFDTPYDSAMREKIDGVKRREKFRLRYYVTDTSFIRLEKKSAALLQALSGNQDEEITELRYEVTTEYIRIVHAIRSLASELGLFM